VLSSSLYCQAPPSLSVGFYDWGGAYPASMSEGVQAIAATGAHVARVYVSPRMGIDYHTGSVCIPDFTLAGAMQDPDVKKAMDNPAISVFILTAYDGQTFSDCETHTYLSPGFYTPAGWAAVVQEYSDLTLFLYQTYRQTNKRFIISNWESDNDIYCGQAYSYATDPAVRAACNASYPATYTGNSSPAESFEGLKAWFQAREQGVEDGRSRALALGIGGMRVYFAPEVNIVRCLHEAGFESTLYDVVPYVKFDYVSYSSYQSMSQTNAQSALLEDLATIQSVVGTNNIIIGEIMTAAPGMEPTAFIPMLERVMDAALGWGVPYLIYWNLYSPSDNLCGVYDTGGQISPVGRFFETYLQGRRCWIVTAGRHPPAPHSSP